MSIITDYKVCISYYGAINKLIIIRILRDKIKMILW